MSAADRIAETTAAQRRAADPSASAFVSANAGAGKTSVLTARVARLLLAGADPSTILCITFTRAAAAEMADRLFKLLGGWALADDEALAAALRDLDGDEAKAVDRHTLSRARRLFARALETPGGLKIQTIHSFCESVLRRFPLEAGVPPGFSVIEEQEAASLGRAAIARVAESPDQAVGEAYSILLSRMIGKTLRELLEDCMASRRRFARAEEIGWAALRKEAAAALGVSPGASSAALADALFTGLSRDGLEAARGVLDASGDMPRKCAKLVGAYLQAADKDARLDALRKLFGDSRDEARSSFGTKATAAIDPSVETFLKEAQETFFGAIDGIRAARAFEETGALYALLERCFAAYAEMKAAHAALDFDDLILATRRLFYADGGAQWVLYKLDAGLAHILLDEGQDTGPDAWEVIERPLDEIFAGENANTFFAVGDQKQSIYSFQGADAALFKQKEADLGKKVSAAHPFNVVPLKASFRSTAPILQFVDELFRRDEVIDNVSVEKPLQHFCTRGGAAGLVELWPLAPRLPTDKRPAWDAPLKATPPDSPAKKLASEVARTIAGWIEDKEILESQGRAIEPGDIMILVQTRGARAKHALFVEMIRALGTAGVPVAGADRLRLLDDQGVLDLVSYARAALYDGDDLSLAETLKSPFFGLDEDSLYDLAAGRGPHRLATALRERKHEREEWRRACDEITASRRVAEGQGAVDFLAHILETGDPSGWTRLAARLGPHCREPIEELLRQAHDFEAARPRSLRLFLDALQKSGAEVSREASESGPMVRVMTVHKAKGLEANIVFLLDAHRYPLTSKIGPVIDLDGPNGVAVPTVALSDARKNRDIEQSCARAKRLIREEYRRLLYVAATRARDRLYICGHQLGNDPNPAAKPPAEKSWHALSLDAFNALGDAAVEVDHKWGGPVRRISCRQTAPVRAAAGGPAPMGPSLADCLRRPAPFESAPRRLAPSRLVGESGQEGAAYSPSRGGGAYLRGRALHRLLELLPEIEPGARRAAADRLLGRHAPAFSVEARTEMREEAMRVLEDGRFAAVFAPGSRAEAAIGGRLKALGGDVVLSGQIDRLAVADDRVLVVDYKTNRPPPSCVEDVAPAYLAQLAAYRALLKEIFPGRPVECALLWTYDAHLMPIDEAALDAAHLLTLA